MVSGSNSGEYINTLETSGSNCGRIFSAVISKEADFAGDVPFRCGRGFCAFGSTLGRNMFVGRDEFINMMTVSGLTTDFAGF